MLIPDNIHPQQSIYYNGAFVLKILQGQKTQDMLDLFAKVKQQKSMTFPVFVLCLDWLFLLNLVILKNDGKIELCI